jgi:hypothetical protein
MSNNLMHKAHPAPRCKATSKRSGQPCRAPAVRGWRVCSFNKLARTFAAQVEALKRYRSSGEQTMRVEHVTVNEGGQAIVGNVTHGRRGPSVKTEPSS